MCRQLCSRSMIQWTARSLSSHVDSRPLTVPMCKLLLCVQMEDALGVEGSDILYVGDHIYSDAALAKINLKWRTALIVSELEREVRALSLGRPHRAQLKELLEKKDQIITVFNTLRIQSLRRFASDRSIGDVSGFLDDEELVNEALGQLILHMQALDREIAPMVESDGHNFNRRWGYLSRAGVNDKSLLQNQIEKYADIYTSRCQTSITARPTITSALPSRRYPMTGTSPSIPGRRRGGMPMKRRHPQRMVQVRITLRTPLDLKHTVG